MRLLLDTHTVLWWLSDPDELRPEARAAIASADSDVYLSAVVVGEMRIKQALGKLELPDDFATALAAAGFAELPVRIAHAHRLAALPDLHRDPFDRLLVAQALVEGLDIVTRDAAISRYPVNVLVA